MSSLRIENKQGFIPKFTQGLRRDLKELVSKDKSLENEALQVLFRLTGKDPEIAGFDISNLKDKTPMTIGEYTDQYNSKLPSEVYNCIRRIYFFMKIAPFEFTIDKKQLEMIPIAKSNCLVGFGFLNGIPVAVKEIPRDSFNPEEIAISLSHPHPAIVTCFGVGFIPHKSYGDQWGNWYVFFEKMDCNLTHLLHGKKIDRDPNSERMRDRIKNIKAHPLAPKEKIRLAFHIISGLCHLHESLVIHRDLKPENVLIKNFMISTSLWDQLCKQCNIPIEHFDDQLYLNFFDVKICDFGHSKEGVSKNNQTVHQKGTPGYRSPESMQNTKYDDKSDIWSFGIILGDILGVSGPRKDGIAPKIHLLDSSLKNDEYICALISLFDKCTQQSPADRPGARELYTQLFLLYKKAYPNQIETLVVNHSILNSQESVTKSSSSIPPSPIKNISDGKKFPDSPQRSIEQDALMQKLFESQITTLEMDKKKQELLFGDEKTKLIEKIKSLEMNEKNLNEKMTDLKDEMEMAEKSSRFRMETSEKQQRISIKDFSDKIDALEGKLKESQHKPINRFQEESINSQIISLNETISTLEKEIGIAREKDLESMKSNVQLKKEVTDKTIEIRKLVRQMNLVDGEDEPNSYTQTSTTKIATLEAQIKSLKDQVVTLEQSILNEQKSVIQLNQSIGVSKVRENRKDGMIKELQEKLIDVEKMTKSSPEMEKLKETLVTVKIWNDELSKDKKSIEEENALLKKSVRDIVDRESKTDKNNSILQSSFEKEKQNSASLKAQVEKLQKELDKMKKSEKIHDVSQPKIVSVKDILHGEKNPVKKNKPFVHTTECTYQLEKLPNYGCKCDGCHEILIGKRRSCMHCYNAGKPNDDLYNLCESCSSRSAYVRDHIHVDMYGPIAPKFFHFDTMKWNEEFGKKSLVFKKYVTQDNLSYIEKSLELLRESGGAISSPVVDIIKSIPRSLFYQGVEAIKGITARFNPHDRTVTDSASRLHLLILQLCYQYAPHRRPLRILELGSGTGYFTACLAHCFFPSLVQTVEISDPVAEQSRENLRKLSYFAEMMNFRHLGVFTQTAQLFVQKTASDKTVFDLIVIEFDPGNDLTSAFWKNIAMTLTKDGVCIAPHRYKKSDEKEPLQRIVAFRKLGKDSVTRVLDSPNEYCSTALGPSNHISKSSKKHSSIFDDEPEDDDDDDAFNSFTPYGLSFKNTYGY